MSDQPTQSMPPSANQNPVLDFYQKWCEKTPFVTRTIITIILVEYILSFFLPLEIWFGNVPAYTLMYFQVYRIILSPFVGNSILTLIILLLSYPSIGSKMEWSMGSSSYLFLIVFFGLVTNISFDCVCLLLDLMGTSDAMYYLCQGFWVVLFSLITIDCMGAPELPRRMMFIPVDIPSKYMPIVMYLLFSLFGGFSIAYAIAIGVGYVSTLGYFDSFKPSSYYLEQLESSGDGGYLHRVSRYSGWVLAGSLGHDSWLPLNNPTSTTTTSQANNQDANNISSFWSMNNNSNVSNNNEIDKNPFPGQGRKLDATTNTNSTTNTIGTTGGSIFGMNPTTNTTLNTSSANTVTTIIPSRQEIAARRLAALSGQI